MAADCWQRLGIAPTADEREVRRAYARCLKVTRPEDDAQGFQQLRDAYDLALQLAAQMAREQEPATSQAPVTVVESVEDSAPSAAVAAVVQAHVDQAVTQQTLDGALQCLAPFLGDAGTAEHQRLLAQQLLTRGDYPAELLLAVAQIQSWPEHPAFTGADVLRDALLRKLELAQRHVQWRHGEQVLAALLRELVELAQGDSAAALQRLDEARRSDVFTPLDMSARLEVSVLATFANHDAVVTPALVSGLQERYHWRESIGHLGPDAEHAWQRLERVAELGQWRQDLLAQGAVAKPQQKGIRNACRVLTGPHRHWWFHWLMLNPDNRLGMHRLLQHMDQHFPDYAPRHVAAGVLDWWRRALTRPHVTDRQLLVATLAGPGAALFIVGGDLLSGTTANFSMLLSGVLSGVLVLLLARMIAWLHYGWRVHVAPGFDALDVRWSRRVFSWRIWPRAKIANLRLLRHSMRCLLLTPLMLLLLTQEEEEANSLWLLLAYSAGLSLAIGWVILLWRGVKPTAAPAPGYSSVPAGFRSESRGGAVFRPFLNAQAGKRLFRQNIFWWLWVGLFVLRLLSQCSSGHS